MTTSTEGRPMAVAAGLALPLLHAFALLQALGCSSPELPPPPPAFTLVSDGRPAMGTVLEISLASGDEAATREWIAGAFAEVARLEALLSGFEPESDVSRLERAAGKGPIAVNPVTRDAIYRALKGSALTRGAFDPSIGPLVALWREAARAGRMPDASQLAAARLLVGAGLVRLPSDASAELPRAGMSIDLGGIAKGYALDRLAASWRERDEPAERGALLSFGQSSVWALGSPPDAPRWVLLLRAPSGGWAGYVELRNQAISISSSLGQWSEIEGRRYGHVVDPRTGRPLERGLEAAVVAPDAAWAEVFSTALLVLGEEEGLELMESLDGCEAMTVDEAGRVRRSSGWQQATRFNRARLAPRPKPGAPTATPLPAE